MGTELKTDAAQRWMMYRKDTYESSRIFLTIEQKKAIEEGKEFAQRAYADVWARDTALVRRVRAFLGENFHWHQRLAKGGTSLEVIQTLQSMIRGQSVVLIAERSRTGGARGHPAPSPAGLPSFRSSLMSRYGMSYEAATAYMERYNEIVDKVNATRARYADSDVSSTLGTASDIDGAVTPLGAARPFEYTRGIVGEVQDVAARGVSMTGNQPGGYRTNPNGLDVDYFDSNGNLCAQYHESHGDAHGHNFNAGARDDAHLPMSPINCR
jgi:hypothetical protein